MIDSRLMNGRPLCPEYRGSRYLAGSELQHYGFLLGLHPRRQSLVGKLRSMGPINYVGFAISDIYMCYAVSFTDGVP